MNVKRYHTDLFNSIIHTLDKNVLFANLRHRSVGGELQAIETALGVGDSPLLLSRGHFCCM